jgi:hypothetical protein
VRTAVGERGPSALLEISPDSLEGPGRAGEAGTSDPAERGLENDLARLANVVVNADAEDGTTTTGALLGLSGSGGSAFSAALVGVLGGD